MNRTLIEREEAYRALAALWDGGRFPHALLIEGAPGSGKRTLAHEAAAMLLCRSSGGSEEIPCGACPSCRKMEKRLHPDLTVVGPEPKKQTIGVDAVRAVRENAWIAPHEADRRVFLIPEAQNLTAAAQNALLKLIEEPPEAAYFLFTVPSRSALLETVCSRASHLPLREMASPRRLAVLRQLRPGEDPALLERLAEGFPTVGQALASLEDPAAQRLEADAAALLDHTLHCERYALMKVLAGYERDREGLSRLLASFRARSAAALAKGELSALQCGVIVDIIEEAQFRVSQNVGVPLLSAVAAARLVQSASR